MGSPPRETRRSSALYAGIFSQGQEQEQEQEQEQNHKGGKAADVGSSWSSALRFVPRKKPRTMPSLPPPSSGHLHAVARADVPLKQRKRTAPIHIPATELERDAYLARAAEEELGSSITEAPYQGPQLKAVSEPFSDLSFKVQPALLAAHTINYCAEYDPLMPNDYALFRQSLKIWRQHRGYNESESEDDGNMPCQPQFALPTLHTPLSTTEAKPTRTSIFAKLGPAPVVPPGPPPQPPSFLSRHLMSKSKPPESTPSPNQADSKSATFAERLMAKYGYKPGEGLGAKENKGIAMPLEITRTGHGRGVVVNNNPIKPGEETHQQFGDPSEILLLEHFDPNAVSEADLRQDVQNECSQHGFVHKVVIYPDESTHLLRVFVQFTGAAGAYRAVRELDGRHVGGRIIRCRYYPAEAFHAGKFVAVKLK